MTTEEQLKEIIAIGRYTTKIDEAIQLLEIKKIGVKNQKLYIEFDQLPEDVVEEIKIVTIEKLKNKRELLINEAAFLMRKK